jgi:hypothetical protein
MAVLRFPRLPCKGSMPSLRAKREMRFEEIVMPALVAGIHVLTAIGNVDGRNKSGHDEPLVQTNLALL